VLAERKEAKEVKKLIGVTLLSKLQSTGAIFFTQFVESLYNLLWVDALERTWARTSSNDINVLILLRVKTKNERRRSRERDEVR
jgi:hypothetical protein